MGWRCMSMFEDERVETGIEEGATCRANDPYPDEASAAQADYANKGGVNEVPATVNSIAPPAKETPTLVEFMSAVVPWPVDNIGHVNLHYSMVNPRASEPEQEPLLKGMGWPFKDLHTFTQRAEWINKTSDFKDVWFCTSRQRDASTNTKGKSKALRRHANAMDLKAIWIDADVKPEDASGKHYTTLQEAWEALRAFRTKLGLPQFSAVVNSGGGLHAYWISDRALTPTEWLPFAAGLKALLLREGVKCDAGLTTDDVRLLRVPGTFNHKYDPPRVVKLIPIIPLVEYNFETALSFLTTIAPAKTMPAASTALFDAAKFAGVKRIIVQATDSLSDGIEKRGEVLLDPQPVFEQCAFMREARETGGIGLDNPLWNLSVLATTFMENGNAIAHQISRGHDSYTHAETQHHFDRKIAERKERGVGWPSCATIQSNGCAACAACPLLGEIKSPLQLGTMRPKPNQGEGTAQQTPNAGKESGGSENRLVVPAKDHLGRARIYRSRQRPNLYHYRDDYYDYEAGYYKIIDDATIRADLYSFLDTCNTEVLRQKDTVVPFAPNKASVSETGEALKALGHVTPTVEQPHWLDGRAGPNPADLICFPNGILNINSNQFTPPDPMLFTPHGVGFDYDPNASAPTEWLNFLGQTFGGEQDQIDALQEMFGYCLSSDVSQEKVPMILGERRSGKDTIRHTLQSLLSSTAVCGPTLDSMSTDFGMSQLIGKQLAVVGDMQLGARCDKDLLAEHVLKLSGRGLFTINRKYKSHWTGQLPCKLLLISNEMPKLKDTSGALASRMIIFQTRSSFYGREDRYLFRDKIRPELPAILLWSLAGLRRMRKRGPIAEPACSIEARQQLAREGSPVLAFVQERLTLDRTAVVDKKLVYAAYLDYAQKNGLPHTSNSWFFRDLETATAGKVKDQRVRKDGENFHNVVGARLTPAKPVGQTEEDVGLPSENDIWLDGIIKKRLAAA